MVCCSAFVGCFAEEGGKGGGGSDGSGGGGGTGREKAYLLWERWFLAVWNSAFAVRGTGTGRGHANSCLF